MRAPPADLDRAALADALDRHWGIASARLEYLPLGFGSHHWRAVEANGSRWFVSADDVRAGEPPGDRFAALDRAFRTAAALRDDAGLEFVLAPVAAVDGAILHRLGARHAVRVEPFVDGTVGEDGEFADSRQRARVGTLIGRLHAGSDAIPPGLPGREQFTLPQRPALDEALAGLEQPWRQGPFGEPARALLDAHADQVRDRLRAYDRQAARVRDQPQQWVLTHGEPHGSNVLRSTAGAELLVDWDTALFGPRERDLWMVLDDDLTGWDEYRQVVGSLPLNDQLLRLYRERWALAEICEYIAEFRRPHEHSDGTRASWAVLGEYLR